MEKIVKIRVQHVFYLLFLSRLFTTLTYIPSLNVDLLVSDKLARIVFSGIFLLVTSIPIYLCCKSDIRANLLNRCECISKAFGKICSFIYATFFIYSAITSIARFDLFATSIMFPQTNFNKFLIIIIFASMIAALFGLEALARSSGIIFGVVIVSMSVILIAVANKFDWLNFCPLFYNGVKPSLLAGLVTAFRTVEIVSLPILMPNISGNVRKGIVWWIVLTEFFILILNFFMVAIMGEYTRTQLFPLYTLTVIAKFKFLERIDVILTGSWIICVYIKLGLMIYLFRQSMQTLISKKPKNIYIYIATVILSVSSMFLTPKSYSINRLLNPYIDGIMFTLTMIVIPTSVLILEKMRKVKNAKK